ncbi:MAG: CPBP family intramembrane metalloprotease [Gemmatimonadetes bacterium]|nr:CPBP family intramembrane metalloprotease [Gemmatimonadota bacterium]
MPHPYPSVRRVLLILLSLPVLQLLLVLLQEDVSSQGSLAVTELWLLWIAGITVRRRRWSPEDVFLLNAAPGLFFFVVAPMTIGAGLVFGQIDRWAAVGWQWLDWTQPLQLQHDMVQMQIISDPGSIAPTLLVMVLLPAICEEAFFRGFLYTGLRYHYGPRIAWVGSSLIFAAAHLNPWQFPALVGLGLFLGWLVHRSHSVYPAMLAHGLVNLLSVVAVNLRTHVGVDPLGAGQSLSPAVLTGAIFVACLAAWRLQKMRPIMPAISPFVHSALHSARSLVGGPISKT